MKKIKKNEKMIKIKTSGSIKGQGYCLQIEEIGSSNQEKISLPEVIFLNPRRLYKNELR